MQCNEIEYGTYKCAYTIKLPYKCKMPFEYDSELTDKYIEVDKCLLPEIVQLWELGIKTTGCCCGHGRNKPFINTKPECIDKMIQLGYMIQFNPCRPNDKDTFYPKTELHYGEINKGFNDF